MNNNEHQPHSFEAFLILALPFIGTAIVIALSYWLYHLDVPTRM